MTRRITLLCVLALLLDSVRAFPTTVVAPTFAELVDHASAIFVGQTVSRRSQRIDTRDGPLITTLVTFSVVETLKGSPGFEMTLEFLGGTVGAERLEVGGMPQFNVGDRDVIFVGNSSNAVSPLVGFAYGRFRITKDSNTGADSVRMFDGRPFASTASLGTAESGFPRADSLPLAMFTREIAGRVRSAAQQRGR